MQTNPPTSLTLGQYILLALAAPVLVFIGSIITTLWNRRKTKPENQFLLAQAHEKEASARSIDAATVIRAYERIDELQEIIDGQRREIQRLEPYEPANKMLEKQVKGLASLCRSRGIKIPDIWRNEP